MPVNRWTLVQFSVLLLALPTQYLVTKYWSSSRAQTKLALQSIAHTAANFKEQYLSWYSWKEWCQQFGIFTDDDAIVTPPPHTETSDAETDALTPKHRDPEGFFAGSVVPRSPRAAHIKFHIGQVIRHKNWGYRGVIVGWDEKALYRIKISGSSVPRSPRPNHVKYRVGQVVQHKVHGYFGVIVGWDEKVVAPEFWLRRNHPKDKPHWRDLPNYAVLVDTKDRPNAQQTYVAEENIEVIMDTEIEHPGLEDFFDAFDGAQYLPKQWLLSLYPHD